jgi:hypothetical protein
MDNSTELDSTLFPSIATQFMSGSVIDVSESAFPCDARVRIVYERPYSPYKEGSTPRSNTTRKSRAVGDEGIRLFSSRMSRTIDSLRSQSRPSHGRRRQ